VKILLLLHIALFSVTFPDRTFAHGITEIFLSQPPEKQSDWLSQLSVDKNIVEHDQEFGIFLSTAERLAASHSDNRFLVRLYILKGRIYATKDQGQHLTDSSLFFLYRAAECAKERHLPVEQIEAILAAAALHQSNGRYQNAVRDTERALALMDAHPDLTIYTPQEKYLIISSIYYRVGNFGKSLHYALKGEQLMPDSLKDYNLYRQIALIYRELQNYPKSDMYYKKCIAVSQTKHNLTLLNYANGDLKYNNSLRESLYLRQKMHSLYTAIIVLSLVLIVGSFFYFRRELHIKKQEAAFLEKEKLYLQEQNKEVTSYLQEARNELSMLAHQIQERGRTIGRLKEDTELTGLLSKQEYKERLTQLTILTEEEWINFKNLFDTAFPGITISLRERYPALTAAEMRLMSLTYLGISSQSMASMLGVSAETVRKTRQRLRKKIDIWEQEDLHDWLARFISITSDASNFAREVPFMRNTQVFEGDFEERENHAE
jgi:tetratricopeptide (TPR) repeat protein